MIGCKHTGEIEYDLTKNEKNFTYKALVVVALKKKTQGFLLFFQTLTPLSRFFSGLENCCENFKTFLRIQDSVRTLSFVQGISIHEVVRVHPRSKS